MLKSYNDSILESDNEDEDLFESPSSDKNKVYKAIKRCAHNDVRVEIGELIPSNWPKEAIDYLLKKKAIEETE